jgi:transposase
MSGKKGMKHYPLALKLEAIRLYQEEGKSQQEITELLGIRDRARVKKWLSAYRRKGQAALERDPAGRRGGRPPKRENTEAYIARLEMENDLLKKFHAELRQQELAKRNGHRHVLSRVIYRLRQPNLAVSKKYYLTRIQY